MPTSPSSGRRDFLNQSVRWAAASGLLAAGFSQASAANRTSSLQADRPATLPHQDHYLLRNVRLEEGFEREGDEIIATQTGLYDISVRDGKIDRLQPAGQPSGQRNLPARPAAVRRRAIYR